MSSARVERATCRLGGDRSIHLSYEDKKRGNFRIIAAFATREIHMGTPVADIGLIGLAVMGQNLVLNMNDHGYKVAVYNRTVSKVDDFLKAEAKGTQVVGAHSVEEFCSLLKKPRRVMIMVKAGEVVDQTIEQVLPYLEKGDIIIDG